jgi:hypothetical protein
MIEPNSECLYRDVGTGSDWKARVVAVQTAMLSGRPSLILHVLCPGTATPVELSDVPWSDAPLPGHAFLGESDGVKSRKRHRRSAV